MQGCREPQKLPWDGLLSRGKVGKLCGKGFGCVGRGADSVGGAKLVAGRCAGAVVVSFSWKWRGACAWGEGIDEQI